MLEFRGCNSMNELYDMIGRVDRFDFDTHHQNSGAVEISNHMAIMSEMHSCIKSGDVYEYKRREGEVAGISVRTINDNGWFTNAFFVLYTIVKRLEDYPILDEDLCTNVSLSRLYEEWDTSIIPDIIDALHYRYDFKWKGEIFPFEFCDIYSEEDFAGFLGERTNLMDYWYDNAMVFNVERYCEDITNELIDPDEIVNCCFADLGSYGDKYTKRMF